MKTKINDSELLKKLRKQIKDRERRFNAMPKNRQRVAIAKDVITSLNTKEIVATQGSYLNSRQLWPDSKEFFSEEKENLDKQVRDVFIDKNPPKCTACAVGSLFVCAVKRHDAITIGEMNTFDRGNLTDYLDKFFDQDQLHLMEDAFETYYDKTNRHNESYNEAEDFGRKYKTAKERMIAIMENVIANDGEFIP